MKKLNYKIETEIFNRFPEFTRGVLVCKNVKNVAISEINFSSLLPSLQVSSDTLTSSYPVIAWRKAFRSMGIDPTKERVSFEALTRRVLNNGDIRKINPLVDHGNFFSVLYQCPVGVHPINDSDTNILLRPAAGGEVFLPLGNDLTENIEPGEIILTNGTDILTRRFCWRQSRISMTTENTTQLFVNFDFLESITFERLNQIMEAFIDETDKFGIEMTTHHFIINKDNSSYNVEL
jgi:DNA/RNA-binding domain of Phe-tRNA-synthetase-like protein